jgi:hypothetical protein
MMAMAIKRAEPLLNSLASISQISRSIVLFSSFSCTHVKKGQCGSCLVANALSLGSV